MTVAFAALHQSLRYRGEDTGIHVLALDDGTTFFSRRPPRLYDSAARRVLAREVLPGTYVKVSYSEHPARKLMEAIQLVREPPDEDPPFKPVMDDELL
jgi:hypothetical protein